LNRINKIAIGGNKMNNLNSMYGNISADDFTQINTDGYGNPQYSISPHDIANVLNINILQMGISKAIKKIQKITGLNKVRGRYQLKMQSYSLSSDVKVLNSIIDDYNFKQWEAYDE